MRINKYGITLFIFTLIFLGIYFYLVTPVKTATNIGPRFDWPDETANYFWISHFVQTGNLKVFEPLNKAAQNQIHPRSFNVLPDGSLVPGSFLGLVLIFGFLAKIFSTALVPYFTPAIAVIGVIAFFYLIKPFFGKKIALLSSILLFFHPAWWYYTASPLLPNVFFISLLLISLSLLINYNGRIWRFLLSAIFLGLAMMIRPSEFIWISCVYLSTFFYLKRILSLHKFLLYLILAAVVFFPVLYFQKITYGSFFNTGYTQLQGQTSGIAGMLKDFLLPFGFSPLAAFSNLYQNYFLKSFWFSAVATIGLILFLFNFKKEPKQRKLFFLICLFLFFWLAIYYGSWSFEDRQTVALNFLGLSYVRYFLPLYVVSLPFAASALFHIADFFKGRLKTSAVVLFSLWLFFYSANLVLYSKPDSIITVKERIASYKVTADEVNNLTETDSVIVTVRKDKVFFPERKVIHTFLPLSANTDLKNILPALVSESPVYYFALSEEKENLSDRLQLTKIKDIDSEILYKVNEN